MDIKVEKIGFLGGRELLSFSITESNGQCITIYNYGGIIHSWSTFDKNKELGDILLGCKNIESYLEGHPNFGCIIGRYGNRIANGRFELNGREYTLAKNLPPHHLHGGIHGFDKKVWNVRVEQTSDYVKIILSYTSPDMEEGYSGKLQVKVIYTYSELGNLLIEYMASTDQVTHFNPTNHCYFNLSAKEDQLITNHFLQINANHYTEVNDQLIPNGKLGDIKDTCLDFNIMSLIGPKLNVDDRILRPSNGFDHNYVVLDSDFDKPKATLYDAQSGRQLEVFSDQPGLQLYTANWLEGQKGKKGFYRNYQGVCLETQHFPDTPNQPSFPSTELRPENPFYSKTRYKLTTLT